MSSYSTSGADQAAHVQQAVKEAHILIVDDMPLMRRMIGTSLERGGFSNLSYAEDGDIALKRINDQPPDLVILDLNMPSMSGYDVCKALRAEKKTKHLPILVQSASETAEERVEVFAVGATDFVSKPINHPELLARVRMHLQNRFLISSLSDYRSRMRSELDMAHDMQQSLLPENDTITALEAAAAGTFEAVYQASSELGGDLWGCWVLPDNMIGMFVLDVSGHGVSAALNTFSLHATMARYESEKSDPARFLLSLNKSLAKILPTGQFATMFYAVLDCETSKLTYAGAGAPPPFIVSENAIRSLDSSGLPIGIISSATYENLEDELKPGESLICYSDVLIEAKGEGDAFLGEEGLKALIADLLESGSRESVVARTIERFRADREEQLPDDLTAIALHRTALLAEAHEGAAEDEQATLDSYATPVVVAMGDWEYDDFDVPSMSGRDLHVVSVSDVEELKTYSRNNTARLGAFVIDGALGSDVCEAAILTIDHGFKDAGGEVFIVCAKDSRLEGLVDKISYVVPNLGLKAFRRQLSQSVSDFVRIEALKQELENRPKDSEPIEQGVFQFKTRHEAQSLAGMLAAHCPTPIPVAIGLSELFLNAIEHGCLNIGHEEKGDLIDQGLLEDEIIARQRDPLYSERFATVEFNRIDVEYTFIVKDPGDGFNHEKYLAEQEAHTKKHGRGIVMAKGCFTQLTYEGCGNEVRAVYLALDD